MTEDTELIIKAAMLQVLLAGIAWAVIRPHITVGAIICALIVLAGELMIYHEVRELRLATAKERAKKRERRLTTDIWR